MKVNSIFGNPIESGAWTLESFVSQATDLLALVNSISGFFSSSILCLHLKEIRNYVSRSYCYSSDRKGKGKVNRCYEDVYQRLVLESKVRKLSKPQESLLQDFNSKERKS